MERLTNKAWRNFDPWECCGQDKYCQKGCHDPGGCTKGCIVPRLYARLGAYEDTELTPEEVERSKLEIEAGCVKAIARTYGIDINRLRKLAEADREELGGESGIYADAYNDLAEDFYSIPAADVAPVTRCKGCVHWDDDPDTYGTDDGPKGKCMKSFETMCADDFCSYGEPKEEPRADDHD